MTLVGRIIYINYVRFVDEILKMKIIFNFLYTILFNYTGAYVRLKIGWF